MAKGLARAGLIHIAVALCYAGAYALLREISFSHWVIFAGFRLCVLLLVPYRYWASLAVGELIPLTYLSGHWSQSFGVAWSLGMLVPPIAPAMPVVRWFRRRGRIFSAHGETDINHMLACSLVVAVVWAAINLTTMSLMAPQLNGGSTDPLAFAGQYFIGMYLGILTVVPLVLVVREELIQHGWTKLWDRVAESRLILEALSLLLPALAILVWLCTRATGDGGEAARIAMFLPVAWLALRHGWRGAAVGGTAASIAVVLSMPVEHDYHTLQAQVFIAFTITTMLLLGARIGVLDRRDTQEKAQTRMALALAQRNVYLGELQLRQASFAIEQIGATVQSTYSQLLGRLRHLLPATDERSYYRQAALTQHQVYRLADSLYPVTWRDRGLPAALREGSIPRVLDEVGVAYWCDIGGRGLSQLSVSVHIALYRLACDAVAFVCTPRNVGKIHLRLRGGSFEGRRWAMLQVESFTNEAASETVRWEELLPIIGGGGMGAAAMADRVAIFEGRVKTKTTCNGRRVSMILFDPVEAV